MSGWGQPGKIEIFPSPVVLQPVGPGIRAAPGKKCMWTILASPFLVNSLAT